MAIGTCFCVFVGSHSTLWALSDIFFNNLFLTDFQKVA